MLCCATPCADFMGRLQRPTLIAPGFRPAAGRCGVANWAPVCVAHKDWTEALAAGSFAQEPGRCLLLPLLPCHSCLGRCWRRPARVRRSCCTPLGPDAPSRGSGYALRGPAQLPAISRHGSLLRTESRGSRWRLARSWAAVPGWLAGPGSCAGCRPAPAQAAADRDQILVRRVRLPAFMTHIPLVWPQSRFVVRPRLGPSRRRAGRVGRSGIVARRANLPHVLPDGQLHHRGAGRDGRRTGGTSRRQSDSVELHPGYLHSSQGSQSRLAASLGRMRRLPGIFIGSNRLGPSNNVRPRGVCCNAAVKSAGIAIGPRRRCGRAAAQRT